MDTLAIRDVEVKLNGKGYVVTIGDEAQKLSTYEAESLFCELLKTLPGIHDRVALAWDQRHDPWIKLVGYYGLDKADNIVVNRWKGEVYYGEEMAFYTRGFMGKDEVIAELRGMYGKDIVVRKEVFYEASKKAVRNEKIMKQARAYAEAKGISMEELWAEVKANG